MCYRLSTKVVPFLLLASCAAAPPGGAVQAAPGARPPAADPAWIAAVEGRLRDASHRFRLDDGAYLAQVREQGLGARFDAAGAHLGADGRPFIGVHTVGFGRGSELPDLRRVGPVQPEPGDCQADRFDPAGTCITRLEIHAPGFTEWWVAGATGFEQGWDLPARPAGSGPVVLDVAVDGAQVAALGSGLRLEADDGAVWIVRGLVASDADGEPVVAEFQRTAEGFRVVVQDEGAVYPIVIDPVYTTADWSAQGEVGFDGGFGYRVAAAGDVNGDGNDDIVVTTSNREEAYLFAGSPSGVSMAAVTTLPSPQAGSYFGESACGAGDLNGDGYDDVVIGAYRADSDLGAAYVYYGSATGLGIAADVTLPGTDTLGNFGYSVTAAGDVNGDGYADLLVGDPSEASSPGAAYLYTGSSSGLGTTPTLTLTMGETADHFGSAVAGAGDVNQDGYDDVIVGAPYYSAGSTRSVGRVYIFEGSASGLSTLPATTLTGATAYEQLGEGVAGAGDVDGDGYSDVLVGAPNSLEVAFVYPGSALGTSTTASTTLTNTEASNFGGVGAAGDVNNDGFADVIVGASGGAYLYAGSATGLNVVPAATLPESLATGAGDTDGDGYDDVVTGDSYYGSGIPGIGAAWVYRGSPTLAMNTPTLLTRSDPYFGFSVASAGDVNADGFGDILVGAYGYLGFTGEVLVYEGSPSGLTVTPSRTLVGSAEDDWFGYSVSAAGDTDNDGYDDVIIGAPGHRGTDAIGAAYVYAGSATGIGSAPSTTIEGSGVNATLGWAVAAAGDVNADGYADVVISTEVGHHVLVFQGSATGTESRISTQIEASDDVSSVSGVGDVNGDGYDDILVGCENYGYQTGEAYTYPGSASGTSSTVSTTLVGSGRSGYFAHSVAGAGDVNGDGYNDVIVGAWGQADGTGSAFVYQGSSAGLSADPSTVLVGVTPGDAFGYSVSGARDLDDDGYDDVLVGAYGEGSAGAVFVFPGAAAGVGSAPADTLTSAGSLVTTVASAGDVNGDGVMDVLIADAVYDSDAGVVSVHAGYIDADGDGIASTEDCDDTDPTTGGATTQYPDTDGDGYGDPANPAALCGVNPGYVADATDCDDTDPGAYPGATEIPGDGVDQDCDGADDAGGDSGAADTNDPTGKGDDPTGKGGCGCSQGAGDVSLLAWILAGLGVRRRREG